MGTVNPALRIEQWSAQAQLPGAEARSGGSAGPSLLETLKAAAQEALQVSCTETPDTNEIKLEANTTAPSAEANCSQLYTPAFGQATADFKPAADMPKLAVATNALKRAAVKAQQKAGNGVGPPPKSPVPSEGLRAVSPASVTRFVHKARVDLAKLEMDIPWDAVQKSWKLHRSHWRKALKQAEIVRDITTAMRELRDALAIPDSPFAHYGGSWDTLLHRCSGPNATADDLAQLLSELNSNARNWIRVRHQHVPHMEAAQRALAMRGLEALWQAVHLGQAALAQCPLEAILDYDEQALDALGEMIKAEVALQGAGSSMGGDEAWKCPAGSIFDELQRPSTVGCIKGSPAQIHAPTSTETSSDSLLVI